AVRRNDGQAAAPVEAAELVGVECGRDLRIAHRMLETEDEEAVLAGRGVAGTERDETGAQPLSAGRDEAVVALGNHQVLAHCAACVSSARQQEQAGGDEGAA